MKYVNETITYSSSLIANVKDFSSETHVHSCYEMLFVFSGEGSFIIEDSEYLVRENSFFVIPPGKYHVMKINNGCDYNRCVINFAPEIIASFLGKKISFHQIADDKIRSLLEKTEEYVEKYNQDAINVLLSAIINEILICATYDEGENNNERQDVPLLVKKAIEYVKANLNLSLSAESIAEALFVSKAHLSHLFSKTMGIGIMHYVSIKKAYKARSLLRKGFSVKEVCDSLGYGSYTTFLRNYRDHFGTNPSEVSK